MITSYHDRIEARVLAKIKDALLELRLEDTEEMAKLDGPSVCLNVVLRRHVERVLLECSGDKLKAARLLDVGKTTLYRWLKLWSEGKDVGI